MISRLQLRGERECIAATLFSPTVYEVATARAKIANYIVVTRFQIRLVVRFHVWQVIFHIYAGSDSDCMESSVILVWHVYIRRGCSGSAVCFHVSLQCIASA